LKTNSNKNLCVTHADRRRLGSWLTTQEGHVWGNPRSLANLEVILEDAESVPARRAPESLVTMNTAVKLVDLANEKEETVTLVYPDDVDLVQGGVSILEPLGTALLGRQEGDVIQCPVEQCQRRLRIARIVYQPEHAGASHL
jgi:regulator of nucleoside diphosphate kinase